MFTNFYSARQFLSNSQFHRCAKYIFDRSKLRDPCNNLTLRRFCYCRVAKCIKSNAFNQ